MATIELAEPRFVVQEEAEMLRKLQDLSDHDEQSAVQLSPGAVLESSTDDSAIDASSQSVTDIIRRFQKCKAAEHQQQSPALPTKPPPSLPPAPCAPLPPLPAAAPLTDEATYAVPYECYPQAPPPPPLPPTPAPFVAPLTPIITSTSSQIAPAMSPSSYPVGKAVSIPTPQLSSASASSPPLPPPPPLAPYKSTVQSVHPGSPKMVAGVAQSQQQQQQSRLPPMPSTQPLHPGAPPPPHPPSFKQTLKAPVAPTPPPAPLPPEQQPAPHSFSTFGAKVPAVNKLITSASVNGSTFRKDKGESPLRNRVS